MWFWKRNESQRLYERTFFSLGTLCNIKLYALPATDSRRRKDDEAAIHRLLDQAEALVTAFDDKCSRFKPNSEISRINRASGKHSVQVSGDTYFLLKKATEYCELSDGKMDITVGPLSKLWRQSIKEGHLPEVHEITAGRRKVDYRKIRMEDGTTSVFLEEEEMEIDLGSVAKGYCGDLVRDMLVENGIEKAIIDLGGNVVLIGSDGSDHPWEVGIQDPKEGRGKYFGSLALESCSVVTSGDYERFAMIDGRKVHHIIDPTSGWPMETDLISVTVISDASIDGDGLTTVAYLAGREEALKLAERMDGVELILLAGNGEIHLSSGLKEKFRLNGGRYRIIAGEKTVSGRT
mgnify:CR=1 FL=1